MNFDLTDTQYALRDVARDLFAKESPASRVRGLWEGKPFERSVWKTMAEVGLCGLTVPESFGGFGGDELDLVLVYEEAGRAALPEPLLETTGIAVPLLAASDLAERWLPAIASGDAIVAVRPPDETLVSWAADADLLIAEIGGRPVAVERGAFTSSAAESLDPARPLSAVDIDASKAIDLDPAGWQRAATRGAFGTAALLNGVCRQLLDRTTSYVADRKQFGRAVGSFQAVKHKLASMLQAVENSRYAAWYAAYAIAGDIEDADEAGSVAKAASCETEALCNRESLQAHGGIGFTWEDDLHLWLKRGMTLRATWGTAAAHRRRLASVVMGT